LREPEPLRTPVPDEAAELPSLETTGSLWVTCSVVSGGTSSAEFAAGAASDGLGESSEVAAWGASADVEPPREASNERSSDDLAAGVASNEVEASHEVAEESEETSVVEVDAESVETLDEESAELSFGDEESAVVKTVEEFAVPLVSPSFAAVPLLCAGWLACCNRSLKPDPDGSAHDDAALPPALLSEDQGLRLSRAIDGMA
jgi:hypothetical protein